MTAKNSVVSVSRFFKFIAVTILICTALPEMAQAGNGSFKDGKFKFCVSVRFNATEAQLTQIRAAFQNASQILADATDGQHRFDMVIIVNNSGASESADYWVNAGPGRAYATLGRYGEQGQHVMLFFDDNFQGTDLNGDAYTIAHEHAHHAYGVADEYSGPGIANGAGCATFPDTATLSFCLMDNYFTRGGNAFGMGYTLNEFCVSSNHDPDGNTFQGISCWETIGAHLLRAATAPAGLPVDAAPSGHTVTFKTGFAGLRVMLLLDRSDSMNSSRRLEFAKSGAKNVVDLIRVDDALGVASFNHGSSVDFTLTNVTGDATRTAAKSTIDAISADGATDIGGGLLRALSQITAQTTRSCNEIIFLLSDGDHNTGTDPDSVIPMLQDEGVTVVSVGVGTDISIPGQATLQRIANRTGGFYRDVQDSFDLVALYTELSMASTGSGLLARAPEVISSGQSREFPAQVEAGAVSASFTVTAETVSAVRLSLRSPSGVVITETSPLVRLLIGDNSRTLRLNAPEAGVWRMVVSSPGSPTPVTQNIVALAFAENDGVQLNLSVAKNELVFPEVTLVQATPRFRGESVVGASVAGTVRRPNGSRVSITLFDDGLAEHADAVAGDGAYGARFSQYFKSGTYTFDLTVTASGGTTFAGEGIFQPFAPSNAKPVSTFTRSASTTAVVTGVPEANLSLNISAAPEPVVTGTNLTYTIMVANSGPDAATSITVTDNLPSAVTFVSCSVSGGSGGTCAGTGNNRTVTFSSLAANSSATITLVTQANCSLADGAMFTNNAIVNSITPDPDLTNNSKSVMSKASNPPPVITCPSNVTAVTALPGNTSVSVNYPTPTVVDNCPGATIVCSPPSGSSFQLGTTTVSCTATDSGGATASCSFTVTVWDVCIRDDNGGGVLLFNSFTGEYNFTRCGTGGFTMAGFGTVSRVGCLTRLEDASKIIAAEIDRCPIAPQNRGAAVIKQIRIGTSFSLKDGNILNNTGSCP